MKLSDCKCKTCFYARKDSVSLTLWCISNPEPSPQNDNHKCGQGLWGGRYDDGEIGLWGLHHMIDPTKVASIEPIEPWWVKEK